MTASELDSYLKTVLVDRKQKQRKTLPKGMKMKWTKGEKVPREEGRVVIINSRMMVFVVFNHTLAMFLGFGLWMSDRLELWSLFLTFHLWANHHTSSPSANWKLLEDWRQWIAKPTGTRPSGWVRKNEMEGETQGTLSCSLELRGFSALS